MPPISKNPKINDQDTAIARIYDSLVADLGAGQKATQGIFKQGEAGLTSAYQGATDSLKDAQGGMAARLGSQLGQLGLGAALPQAMSGANEGYAFNQGQIAKTRAADIGSLSKQGTQYQAIGQLGIGNAQKEKAQTRVSAMERLEAVMAELEAARIKGESDVEIQRLSNQVELAKIRADAADRAASRAAASAPDPFADLKAQGMTLENQLMLKKLMGGDEEVEIGKGQAGLNQFMNAPSMYWDRGAGPKFTRRLDNIIDATANWRTGAGQFADYDPFDYAMSLVPQTKGTINKDALRQALQIYYG